MTIAHTSTCFFGSVFGGFGICAQTSTRMSWQCVLHVGPFANVQTAPATAYSPNTALTTLKKTDQAGMMNRNIAGQHI